MADGMQKIVATGYELELLNSMIERTVELYELPAETQEALANASNLIQEQAVALDMIDSIQTSSGPLRRSFSEQDLVVLHSLIVDAQTILAGISATRMVDCIGEVRNALSDLAEARKTLEHPDNE